LNLLKKKDIDIIVSYTFKMHILSIFIKPLLARIIWQYCDLLPENKILKKIVLLIAGLIPEKIITNSNYVKEEFTRNNIHEDKVVSFYDGFILRDLSVSEKERVEFRNKFNLSSEDFAVGCLGALVEWKGQEYLIRATKIIQGQIPHLRIFIIGDKIYDTATKGTKEYLMNLVNELGLADIVTFTGFINENRQIISVLDLIVHTSIKPEPFGRVVVEGMLMAKPVIATAAGGIPEIIENNKDGIMISPKDENALAEAIMKLYKNKEERYLLGSSALRKAADKFDIQKRIEVLEGVYS
jgi:glycosyltransferase involved in cell wall biosynthesis